MANKHTTTLEFEVYGKRNIEAIREALQEAGVAMELVETTAVNAKNKIQGMSQMTRVASATLHGLSAAQREVIKESLKTANLSGKLYKPWMKESIILKTEEQIQKERDLQEELKRTQKVAADALKAQEAAKIKADNQAERDRKAKENEAKRDADKAEREKVAAANKAAREAENARNKAARKAERERETLIRNLRRSTGLDERGIDLRGKSVSGPIRVVVYDLVRRTLTEIYGLVNKIGRSVSNWIIDGIKFNDELKRSQTFFTSLGILGLKAPGGAQMTVAEARTSQDPKTQDMYKKSVASSEVVMRRLMSVAAMTGQDLGEIVSSTRQAMTDLLNKVNKDGKAGAYLENADMLADVSERMVKLGSVLRMADPSNRKLSFHMVALQELFSGTAAEGKKKGKEDSAGMQNMRSMLMREGIKIGEERMRKITQYVNTGNLTAAMDEVQSSLERSGLGFEQLSNMVDSTLQPAIDGVQMYLRIFNKIFTSDLYENILKPFFQALLKHMYFMEKNKTFVDGIERLGKLFSSYVDKILTDFAKLIDYFTLIPDYTDKANQNFVYKNLEDTGFGQFTSGMSNIISTIGAGAEVMYAIFKVITQFMIGLLGSKGGDNISELAKQIESFGESARKAGVWIRSMFEWITEKINNNSLFGFKISHILMIAAGVKTFIFLLRTAAALSGALALTKGAIGLASKTGIGEAIMEKISGLFKKGQATSPRAPSVNLLPAAQQQVAKSWISEMIGGAFLAFSDAIKNAGKKVGNVFSKILDFFKPGRVAGRWQAIGKAIQVFATEWVPKLFDKTKGGFKAIGPTIAKYLPEFVKFLIGLIPQVRIATVIATVLLAVVSYLGPMVLDKLREGLPPLMEKMMKGSIASISPFSLPATDKSWMLNPFDLMGGQVPVAEPRTVTPKGPNQTNNNQEINIGTVNVNAENMQQFVNEVQRQAGAPGRIPFGDPSFRARDGK